MKNNKLISFAFTAVFASGSFAATLPAPVTDADYYDDGNPAAAKVELGRLLFFDKILSGNKNISCATCHHPQFFGSDGLSVSVGEGGVGLGPTRSSGSGKSAANVRIGRHSPSLFNLGAKEFIKLNWDGRHKQTDSGLDLPCSTPISNCPDGLDNVLAGQNLFPLATEIEMTGGTRENEVIMRVPPSTGGNLRFPYIWNALLIRLRGIPEYVSQFSSVYGLRSAGQMTIAQAVNAMAAFEATAFRSDQSPFDKFLGGDTAALTTAQQAGMELFYGSANCVSCHSGKFQTDHSFHAIAMPQLGAGVLIKERSEGQRDMGLFGLSGEDADRFKFRTPSLRNIEKTAPYGHDGAYATLESVVQHHLDPENSFNNWDRSQVILATLPRSRDPVNDFAVMDDAVKAQEILDANALEPVSLSSSEISDLIEFLKALTDPNIDTLVEIVPTSVPSGLPVAD